MNNIPKNKVTIEIYDCFDWVRNYNAISIHVAIKAKYQQYDVGKEQTTQKPELKTKQWIKDKISLTSFNKKNLHISFIISTFVIEKTRAKVKLWSMVSSGYKKYLLKYV